MTERTPEERLQTIFAAETGCTLPCWNGITPGQTSEQELITAAEDDSRKIFHDFTPPPSTTLLTETRWYDWSLKEAAVRGSARISNSHVDQLSFQPNSILPLEALIGLLNTPSDYVATFVPGERDFVGIALFYGDRGIVVKASAWWSEVISVECRMIIDQSTEIDAIYLVEPDQVEVLASEIQSIRYLEISTPMPWETDHSLVIQACPQ